MNGDEEVESVGVVDEDGEPLVPAVEGAGLVDQLPLDLEVAAVELDLEGLAEDAQGVVAGVPCAARRGRDQALGA